MTRKPEDGVSVSIFCGFIRLAEKCHGRKMAAAEIEKMRSHLAQAEALYANLPDEPKREKRSKKGDA